MIMMMLVVVVVVVVTMVAMIVAVLSLSLSLSLCFFFSLLPFFLNFPCLSFILTAYSTVCLSFCPSCLPGGARLLFSSPNKSFLHKYQSCPPPPPPPPPPLYVNALAVVLKGLTENETKHDCLRVASCRRCGDNRRVAAD